MVYTNASRKLSTSVSEEEVRLSCARRDVGARKVVATANDADIGGPDVLAGELWIGVCWIVFASV